MYPGFASQYVGQLRTVDLRDYRILVHEGADAAVAAG